MVNAMSLRAALGAVRRHPFSLVVPVITDFIALIVFASLYSSLFLAATSQITTINGILSSETAAFVASGGALAVGDNALVAQEMLLSSQMAVLAVNILLIVLLAYVLFTISQTIDWWFAHRAVRRFSAHADEGRGMAELGKIVLRMLWLNLLWFAVLLFILGFSGYLMGQAGSSPVPILGQGFYVALTLIALVVWAYFLTVSHAFILQHKPLRTSLRMAVLRASRYGVPFGVIALGIAAFSFIIPPVGAWHYLAGIVLFLVLLCGFAFGRVLLAELATAEVRS